MLWKTKALSLQLKNRAGRPTGTSPALSVSRQLSLYASQCWL